MQLLILFQVIIKSIFASSHHTEISKYKTAVEQAIVSVIQ